MHLPSSYSIYNWVHEDYLNELLFPFSCFYAVNVNDADFVEKKIHEAFDDVRLNESREFFTIAPEKVKAALEITGGKDVTPSGEIIDTEADLIAIEKQRNKFTSAVSPVFGEKILKLQKLKLLGFLPFLPWSSILLF